jgi:hypothetical protein
MPAETMSNFQREGSISNPHVGREFEGIAKNFFQNRGITLIKNLALPIGVGTTKKSHSFDLGNKKLKVIVECKSHKWTKGRIVPSAKMAVWNEAMYYFYLAPPGYRKIFFVLKDYCSKRGETLAEYYLRTYGHFIPSNVEIWEYDQETGKADKIN